MKCQAALEGSCNCWDRKARAASAQRFTLAASSNRDHPRDHSLIPLVRATHIYSMVVIFRAHPDRGESHIQRNANREVSTQHKTLHHTMERTFCGVAD